MGSLNLPKQGLVYVDAMIVIYSVDGHPIYSPICAPLWQAAQKGDLTVVSSELIIMETRIGPIRAKDMAQVQVREDVWKMSGTLLLPITLQILRDASNIRAGNPAIKTPDAIHISTAMMHKCALFVTNDIGFRRVPGLPAVFLDEILSDR